MQILSILLVEFEICLKKLLEDQLIVFHKGTKLLLSIFRCLVRVPWVLDFVTQVVDNIRECFEVKLILSQQSFVLHVGPFLH